MKHLLTILLLLIPAVASAQPPVGSMGRQNADAVNVTGGSITGLTKLAGSAGSNLTISSGAITVNRPIHTVLGEGDVADDLVTINGGSEGQLLMLHGVDAGYNITIKEQVGGNIATRGLSYLLESNLAITLIYHDDEWHVIGTLPTVLPAISGANLTSLNATNLSSGQVHNDRLSANLKAIGNLTSAANKLPYFTGDGTADVTDLSSLARQINARATAALMRTDLQAAPYGIAIVYATDGTQAPYSTLADAKAAATSGQTVVVGPGSYTITSTLAKNGVNWYFDHGAVVTASSCSHFDDGGSNLSFTVGGYGKFIVDGNAEAIDIEGDGVISITGDSFENDAANIACIYIRALSSGTQVVHARNYIWSKQYDGIWHAGSGDFYASGAKLLGGSSSTLGNAIEKTSFGRAHINFAYASSGGPGIRFEGGTLHATVQNITSDANIAIQVEPNNFQQGTFFLNCQHARGSLTLNPREAANAKVYINEGLIDTSHVSGVATVSGTAETLGTINLYLGRVRLLTHSGQTNSLSTGSGITTEVQGTLSANKLIDGSSTISYTGKAGDSSNLAGTTPTATGLSFVGATDASAARDAAGASGGIFPSSVGGTGNGFTKLAGPASSEKTWTGPNANATLLTNQPGEINALTEKTTPHDDDWLLIEDSEASNAKKKLKVSNLPGGGGGSGDIEGVTAGSGLTGGGTSGTPTLNVGAGTGITVNADDVAIGDAELLAILGLTSAADKLPYFTGSGTASLADFTSFGRQLVDDSDASTARTTLGLAIGTNVQAYNANLTTYAGIAPSSNVQSVLGAADYSAMRTLLSLVVGTNVQAYDADLTTYAGITPSANIQSLLASADYAAVRTNLGLVIGTNVQAYDADLTTWAGVTPGTGVATAAAAATNSNGGLLTVGTSNTTSASSMTPTGGHSKNYIEHTAQGEALTINAPSGTPAPGNTLMIVLTDDGTGRALTWDSAFQAEGVALPTTTTAGKTLSVGFRYTAKHSKWGCVAVAEQE